MKYFKVLYTEDTADFARDLIGDTFLMVGTEGIYIKLDTCDGMLSFLPHELEEVKYWIW